VLDKSRAIIKNLQFYDEPEHACIVIAHRGSSSDYPENTVRAFQKAEAVKADMIELDIQLSKDGIPMVFHDDTLERCTNGTGKLNQYTCDELRKLDAGGWKNPDFSGEKIPTLEEVLSFAKNKIAVNVEIKAHDGVVDSGIEVQAFKLVKKYEMERHVLFSCFNTTILKRLRELSGTIPLALLYERNNHLENPPIELINEYQLNAFNCSKWSARKRWIKELKRHDIPMMVYTVNSQWLMKKLIKNGVKGIFTNKPDVLRQQLEMMNNEKIYR